MLRVICKECSGESYGDTMCISCKDDRWWVDRGTKSRQPVHMFGSPTWSRLKLNDSACQAAHRIVRRRGKTQERGRAAVARRSYKLEVEGPNPSPATIDKVASRLRPDGQAVRGSSRA